MNCETCTSTMQFLYDVTERDTTFSLWECSCGHKHLERTPASDEVPSLSSTKAS